MSETNHHRRSIRLKGFDYSQAGAYFVTVVTQNRLCVFGEIQNEMMILNDIGKMIENCWLDLPNRFPTIDVDEYVIMPNHFHGIIIITDQPVGSTLVVDQTGVGTSPTPTVGDIIGAFKSITTHEYIIGVKRSGWSPFDRRIWQRNFYEHIIRNDADLQRVREYIQYNPLKWNLDQENPQTHQSQG